MFISLSDIITYIIIDNAYMQQLYVVTEPLSVPLIHASIQQSTHQCICTLSIVMFNSRIQAHTSLVYYKHTIDLLTDVVDDVRTARHRGCHNSLGEHQIDKYRRAN